MNTIKSVLVLMFLIVLTIVLNSCATTVPSKPTHRDTIIDTSIK